jgi:hypothetical protein
MVAANDEKAFLSYEHQGGLTSREKVAVSIDSCGCADVRVQRQTLSPIDYTAQLSAEELEALRTLVRITDFFAQPERDVAEIPTDTGTTEVTLVEPDRRRTLKFEYRPALDSLAEFLWKLVTQAEAIDALGRSELHDVLNAVSTTSAGAKALQPTAMKGALMDYLRNAKPEHPHLALRALAAVTTPEEFAGFAGSLEFEPGAKMQTHLPTDDYPEDHRLALCPLFLEYLKREFPTLKDYRREDIGPAYYIAQELGDLNYKPALTYFMELFDASTESSGDVPIPTLIHFGSPAIREIAKRLTSPRETHRLVALELLANASSLVHQRAFRPLSEYERDEMRRLFAELVLPKLASIAKKDASETVRERARISAEQIGAQLKTQPSGPFVRLSVTPDFILKRTLLNGEINRIIVWDLFRDGQRVVRREATGQTEYRPDQRLAGNYTAFVSALIEDQEEVVSNVVFYRIP